MDNKKIKTAVDGVNTAYSLAVMLARGTEDDPHANVLATQIVKLLRSSANDFDEQLTHAASNAA